MATRRGLHGRSFSLSMQAPGLEEVRRRLGSMGNKAPSVMANALNQTLTQLKKHIQSQVAEEYTYKKKLQKPKSERASYKKLRALLRYSPVPFSQIQKLSYKNFEFKPGAAGTPRNASGTPWQVKIRSDEGFKDKPRAFEMNGTMFRRRGRERYPLSYAVGPGEQTMVREVWKSEKAQELSSEILSKKLDEQINKQYLKKWGAT